MAVEGWVWAAKEVAAMVVVGLDLAARATEVAVGMVPAMAVVRVVAVRVVAVRVEEGRVKETPQQLLWSECTS